jgi:hypothetical protein
MEKFDCRGFMFFDHDGMERLFVGFLEILILPLLVYPYIMTEKPPSLEIAN